MFRWTAQFHIAVQDIAKSAILTALKHELRKPVGLLDRLVAPHVVAKPQPLRDTAYRLNANPGLDPTDQTPSSNSRPGSQQAYG